MSEFQTVSESELQSIEEGKLRELSDAELAGVTGGCFNGRYHRSGVGISADILAAAAL